MRVLVVGKGGREHAIAQKISESKMLETLWVAPGNPGMSKVGLQCVNVEKTPDVLAFCKTNRVDLVVFGPEAAILSDLKEVLEANGVACLAPSREAAHLEASKYFCKEILEDAGLLTAAYQKANTVAEAISFLEKHDFKTPIVVKADGLAAGKGVAVCETLETAKAAVHDLTTAYGFPLLVEECLIGRELSAFALCDGEDFVILGTACDYKRITPDPFSANTGGMGAFSPCDFISTDDEAAIDDIFRKSLKSLKRKGKPYVGFLFAGLMKTDKGLYVLEFNVRLGDPETQALLPRIKSDLLDLSVKAVQGRLEKQKTEFHDYRSVHVVAVSKGYPGNTMDLGHAIQIPTASTEGTNIYFAGVSTKNENLVNTGGRVLGVTALAKTRDEARMKAYQEIRKVQFQGLYFREDIAQ
ncbi:phosphoribosylamine--glycine ligase [Bdellovibrio sp. SKB1291214]|uniref:phosphoribosylamine--glycine ligase n=1 Tax=Bdellovibrio sp. SKB1291214 TaxID=1732569 RepID=UPI000B518C86|nr:phosphoribosylamine--glycine ligase [Bdellovibrio sp. SKB1291214]UYL08439.1 phosphoribosylamine--glycine ligase [Bdellovibrio sp. SKB1291214]